jgi:hypothetical protein
MSELRVGMAFFNVSCIPKPESATANETVFPEDVPSIVEG